MNSELSISDWVSSDRVLSLWDQFGGKSDGMEWEKGGRRSSDRELSLSDQFGGKSDGMEWTINGGRLSSERELSIWDQFGGKSDIMEWDNRGGVSLDAETREEES